MAVSRTGSGGNTHEIKGIGTNGIAGDLIPSMPQRCLGSKAQGAWLIDPVVLDSALQMIIVWTRMHWDMTPLPSRMQSYKRFGSLYGTTDQLKPNAHRS